MTSLYNLPNGFFAEQILFFFNFALCVMGGYICICRMKFIRSHTKKPIRWHYIMWLTLFGMSAMSWWLFGDPPTLGQFLLGVGGMGQLMLGAGAWKDGAPSYSIKTVSDWEK